MSLAQCRYNPNHKMKPSKREIHEQKCQDKYRCKIKYKYCPYNPIELIKEEDYDYHILICKSRPRIIVEDRKIMDKSIELNDINKEKKEISISRLSLYKTYSEKEEISELNSNFQKNNEKRWEKEVNEIVDMIKNDNEYESHEIKDFDVDNNFELKDKKENQFQIIRGKKAKADKKSLKENIIINKNNLNIIKENYFCKYDPNEEDKDINKYSANIIIPNIIKRILKQ